MVSIEVMFPGRLDKSAQVTWRLWSRPLLLTWRNFATALLEKICCPNRLLPFSIVMNRNCRTKDEYETLNLKKIIFLVCQNVKKGESEFFSPWWSSWNQTYAIIIAEFSNKNITGLFHTFLCSLLLKLLPSKKYSHVEMTHFNDSLGSLCLM